MERVKKTAGKEGEWWPFLQSGWAWRRGRFTGWGEDEAEEEEWWPEKSFLLPLPRTVGETGWVTGRKPWSNAGSCTNDIVSVTSPSRCPLQPHASLSCQLWAVCVCVCSSSQASDSQPLRCLCLCLCVFWGSLPWSEKVKEVLSPEVTLHNIFPQLLNSSSEMMSSSCLFSTASKTFYRPALTFGVINMKVIVYFEETKFLKPLV